MARSNLKTPNTTRSSRRPSATARRRAAQQAFKDLLEGLGCQLRGELRGTPARAAHLWAERLLKGEGADLRAVLGRGVPSRATTPVIVRGMGVHLVCPHHLTIAFGEAHVAYLPAGRLAGFGRIAELVEASTARLVLQEEATEQIAEALVEGLGARAAVATLAAVHPCHNLVHPRSHRAQAVTWGAWGEPAAADELRRLLRDAVATPVPGQEHASDD